MTISRVKFPWPPFFRIFIFFDEVFNLARGTTYLMRDDGATVVNLRPSRVIWSFPNPTDLSVHPCKPPAARTRRMSLLSGLYCSSKRNTLTSFYRRIRLVLALLPNCGPPPLPECPHPLWPRVQLEGAGPSGLAVP